MGHSFSENTKRLVKDDEGSLRQLFPNLIGQSPVMLDIFSQIRKVAPSDISVLVTGESGTGKELVARAIHRLNPRSEKSFVAINCAAIPENLLESELFGYEKGAFTGAYETKKGRLEFAHDGTLFLDEIGELSQVLQVKLLRFLEEKTFQRIGGKKDISLNVRVICATNQDLTRTIETGNFREDLYYRINVFHIHLPPLRDRGDDVILIAKTFLQREVTHFRKKNLIRGFAKETFDAMMSHSWPGNVREIANRIKRAVLMSDGPYIDCNDLGLVSSSPDTPIGLREAKERLEREMISSALRKHNGRIGKAADELGVSRQFLRDLLIKHHFDAIKKMFKS